MKKKIILVAFMVAMLVCLFAISVSASDLAYDRVYTIDGTEYPLWEQDSEGNYHPLMWYKDEDKLSKVYADNTDSTQAPYVTYSAYTNGTSREIQNFNITDVNGNIFNGKSTVVIANLHNIYLKAGDLGQITHINKNAFMGSTALKAVYIPESIVYLGYKGNNSLVPFEGCSALEYAEFAPSATITSIDCNTFLNCTSLKAISLPESIKSINYSTFGGCTSLKAVYLPRNLEGFVKHHYNTGAFYNCSNMYFVSKPFVVENIETDVPARESVYYFPANLTELGECIRGCTNINDVLVIGDKITSHSTTMYTGTGQNGATKTVVYLGNMTSFSHNEGIEYAINFVLPNTTTPKEEFTVSVGYKQYNGNILHFCKLGVKCELKYGSVSWTEESMHFAEDSKSVIIPATCTTNETATTYCFCNKEIETVNIENTVLGHNHSDFLGLIYENYSNDGYYSYKCERCDDVNNDKVAPALFKCLGYSAPEDGRGGIAIGYTVNNVAIAEYEEVTSKTLKYGVFAVLQNRLGDNDVFAEDGTVAEGVINAEITNYEFVAFELKIIGFTDAQKDVKLAMGAYVAATDGETTEYSYMQGGEPNENEKYCFVSYNDIVGKSSTEEEVTR